jgi:HYR domain
MTERPSAVFRVVRLPPSTTSDRRLRRSVVLAFAVLLLVPPATAQAGVKLIGLSSATGALELRARLGVTSSRALCPPGTPGQMIECRARRGTGLIRGLGRVSHSYLYIAETFEEPSPATCTHPWDVRILATTVRLSTAGKGDVDVSLEAVPTCMHPLNKLSPPGRAFTVTGGTGIYAGASGGGTLKHSLRQAPGGAAGTDTWAGTLVVPGLEFDLTPPQLTEAAARIVRVPRQSQGTRVRFTVSASDDVDGALPVKCTPRSGSRFKLGKTRVTCSASDSGGNTATARSPSLCGPEGRRPKSRGARSIRRLVAPITAAATSSVGGAIAHERTPKLFKATPVAYCVDALKRRCEGRGLAETVASD